MVSNQSLLLFQFYPYWIVASGIIPHNLDITVSEEELRRLGKRFKKLDIDKNGTISIEEFMSLPELQQNPLVRRVIDLFDTDRNGEIDFKGKTVHDTVK